VRDRRRHEGADHNKKGRHLSTVRTLQLLVEHGVETPDLVGDVLFDTRATCRCADPGLHACLLLGGQVGLRRGKQGERPYFSKAETAKTRKIELKPV
jgi:hypothetical protein